ncbi:hypothetical protein ACHAQA_002692 [Verticillium albo-atrum]
MTLSAPLQPKKVGVIIGSQRAPRAGPQITGFVLNTIKLYQEKKQASATVASPPLVFELVDIAALDLPFFNEPGIPSKILDPADYAHEHTRAWSRTISALDAFIFVTPQYNWGIPAGLKNAIDYLFHEWKGKPAMIVSYGGHGGDKCAAALSLVLRGGIGVHVVEKTVNLAFPSRDVLVAAATGKALGLDAESDEAPWADQRGEIEEVWEQVVHLLERPS